MRRLVSSASTILVLVLVLSWTTVWAASTSLATTVSNFVHDSLFGAYAKVTNNLFAVDLGFATATQSRQPSGNTLASPTIFSPSPGIATNGITQGDWVVTFAVNTTATTTTGSSFTVTLIFYQGSVSSSFKLYLSTGSVPTSPPFYEVLCEFDIGSSLSSPYSYTFLVL